MEFEVRNANLRELSNRVVQLDGKDCEILLTGKLADNFRMSNPEWYKGKNTGPVEITINGSLKITDVKSVAA